MDKQTFDSLPLSIQNYVIDVYKKALAANGDDATANALNIEKVFGKDNLTFLPRAWDELVEKRKHAKTSVQIDADGKASIHCGMARTMPVCAHCMAAIKISQLIEKSYGGLIDDSEWLELWHENVYVIRPEVNLEDNIFQEEYVNQDYIIKKAESISDYTMLAFRSQALAEEFVKYNYDLVRDFFKA